MTDAKREPKEPELADDYPVYFGYLYVADGKVVEAEVHGTVNDLKRFHKATVVTICDIAHRDLWHLAV